MSDVLLLNPPLVRLNNPVRIMVEAAFVLIAALLPAFVHSMGWNGAVLLPMHWTVLLAGLVFGPLGGFAAGLASPLLSYALSGLPAPAMLLPMTAETAAYGLAAGLFRRLHLNMYLSTFFAMLSGRIVYTFMFLGLGRISGPITGFWQKAFVPGLVSAAIMLLALPLLASLLGNVLQQRHDTVPKN
ncbi:MAG: ECF transporter S component [Treponema sp.]|nr:ECF transporter S component [Treponema sp.]